MYGALSWRENLLTDGRQKASLSSVAFGWLGVFFFLLMSTFFFLLVRLLLETR